MSNPEDPKPGASAFDEVISSTPLTEDADAGSRLTPPTTTPQQQRETTRTKLAWALVLSLIALVGVGATGWLLYGNDVERMQTFAIVFAPIVTLVGTVLGFYFSSKD